MTSWPSGTRPDVLVVMDRASDGMRSALASPAATDTAVVYVPDALAAMGELVSRAATPPQALIVWARPPCLERHEVEFFTLASRLLGGGRVYVVSEPGVDPAITQAAIAAGATLIAPSKISEVIQHAHIAAPPPAAPPVTPHDDVTGVDATREDVPREAPRVQRAAGRTLEDDPPPRAAEPLRTPRIRLVDDAAEVEADADEETGVDFDADVDADIEAAISAEADDETEDVAAEADAVAEHEVDVEAEPDDVSLASADTVDVDLDREAVDAAPAPAPTNDTPTAPPAVETLRRAASEQSDDGSDAAESSDDDSRGTAAEKTGPSGADDDRSFVAVPWRPPPGRPMRTPPRAPQREPAPGLHSAHRSAPDVELTAEELDALLGSSEGQHDDPSITAANEAPPARRERS